MGWQDRPYAYEDESGPPPRSRPSYHGSGLGALSVTSTLIIVNIAVYFLMYHSRWGRALTDFGVMQAAAVWHGQVWRLFTATYMHAGFNHIFFNMLGLYFFGPSLERVWGPRQFFFVYTLGGIVGNIVLTLAAAVGFIDAQTFGLGASGSVLTLLGAAAVLFPEAQVFVYFLFPVRIRTFVAIYGIWFLYNVIQQGHNYGGDLCHLGGLAVGLWWGYTGGLSLTRRHRAQPAPGSLLGRLHDWFHRVPRSHSRPGGPPKPPPPVDERRVDQILAKIRAQGLDSLTEEEKETLAEASRRRRERLR